MESVRLICDTEIPVLQQKMDASSASFRKSLESLRARSNESAQYQGEGSRIVYFQLVVMLVSQHFLSILGNGYDRLRL